MTTEWTELKKVLRLENSISQTMESGTVSRQRTEMRKVQGERAETWAETWIISEVRTDTWIVSEVRTGT
jgi:hypothetical protein